jgi:hypothetical protein
MAVEDKRNKDARYQAIPAEKLLKEYTKIENFCKEYLDSINYPSDVWIVRVSRFALFEIIERVDKREAYYWFFHESISKDGKPTGMIVNERKLGALYAYWIAKIRPISVEFRDDILVDAEGKELADNLNENFAACVFYSHLIESYGSNDNKLLDSMINSPFHETLTYALRYRNISIDAMMVLAEAITIDTFKRSNTEMV